MSSCLIVNLLATRFIDISDPCEFFTNVSAVAVIVWRGMIYCDDLFMFTYSVVEFVG